MIRMTTISLDGEVSFTNAHLAPFRKDNKCEILGKKW